MFVDGNHVRRYPLPRRGDVVVGRSSIADLQLDHPEISRRHFKLSLGWRMKVQDLGSRNGIEISGDRVPAERAVPVKVGQPMTIGAVTLLLEHAIDPDSPLPIVIDVHRHEIRSGEIRVSLATRPVLRRLVYALASCATWKKEALVAHVWNVVYHPLRHDNVLRVTIHQARALLQSLRLEIQLVPDLGYLLVPPRDATLQLVGT